MLLTGYRSYGNLISDEMKCEFFQAAGMSELLYGCTPYT